jgi:hypothetical protein
MEKTTRILFLVSGVISSFATLTAGGVVNLTYANYEAETTGKSVFIKVSESSLYRII